MEACDAHTIANYENERKFQEGVDSGGGPEVPSEAARSTQQLPACPREKEIMYHVNVELGEQRKACTDTGRKTKVRGAPQEPADDLRLGMRLKRVHRALEFDQEPWMEPYIRMNTEFRKAAKSDFETKLMSNSGIG